MEGGSGSWLARTLSSLSWTLAFSSDGPPSCLAPTGGGTWESGCCRLIWWLWCRTGASLSRSTCILHWPSPDRKRQQLRWSPPSTTTVAVWDPWAEGRPEGGRRPRSCPAPTCRATSAPLLGSNPKPQSYQPLPWFCTRNGCTQRGVRGRTACRRGPGWAWRSLRWSRCRVYPAGGVWPGRWPVARAVALWPRWAGSTRQDHWAYLLCCSSRSLPSLWLSWRRVAVYVVQDEYLLKEKGILWQVSDNSHDASFTSQNFNPAVLSAAADGKCTDMTL